MKCSVFAFQFSFFLWAAKPIQVRPGVAGSASAVGPPLNHIANRSNIAGVIPNTPENLARWIRHPQQIHPGSDMPEMHVTSSDAKIIALYLETLH